MKDAHGAPGSGPSGSGLHRTPEEPHERVRRAMLHGLAAGDRILLLLWYAEGMTREEIAACLHSTPAQVEAAHERVLRELRRAVEGWAPAPAA